MWFANLFRKKEEEPTKAMLNAEDKALIEKNSKLLLAVIPFVSDPDLCNEVNEVVEELKFLIPSHNESVMAKDKEISIEIQSIVSLLDDSQSELDYNELYNKLRFLKSRIKIRNAEI